MANGNLITQAQKMYESELDTTDYAKLLTEPAVKAVGEMLKVQRVKTEALMAAMPAGVNISKVPEELRGKVTEYLTKNKAAYTEAAKVVASGIKPTDQRYIDAIETMNKVRGGFEALDASLVNVAEKRKAALESRDNISAGAHDHDSILHEKWSNGDIYNDFTLEDGNFYYTDHEGNKVNANDYAGTMQQSTGITDAMVGQGDRARELGLKGFNFEDEEGNFRGSINSMLKNAGKDGRVDFAYSGVYGADNTPFIDTYIKENHPPEEYDQWYAHYKNEDFSAGTDMGNKLREYLMGTLRGSYDSGVAAKAAEDKKNQKINTKTTWDTSFGNPSKVRANNFIDKINNNSETVTDLRGFKWILQEDGTYTLDGDSSQVRTRTELIEENEMEAYYPDIYSDVLDADGGIQTARFNPDDDADAETILGTNMSHTTFQMSQEDGAANMNQQFADYKDFVTFDAIGDLAFDQVAVTAGPNHPTPGEVLFTMEFDYGSEKKQKKEMKRFNDWLRTQDWYTTEQDADVQDTDVQDTDVQEADGSKEKPFTLQEGEEPTRGKYYKLESGIFKFDGNRYIPVEEE